MTARHLRIHGLVQGVGYRYAMVREAERLGVAGWVRNRSDGTVEALVVGTEAAVGAMTDWAYAGPRGARVTRVDVAEASGEDGAHSGFELRPTV